MTPTTTTDPTRGTPAVTALGDDAATAAVTSAAKSLGLPTVRAEASRIAAALTHLAYLAEVPSVACDDRDHRRRIRQVHQVKFPGTSACQTSMPAS